MWDNTDKQDEEYTDYLSDLGFVLFGMVIIVAMIFIGWMLY